MSAKELVTSLRAKETGRATYVGVDSAKQLSPYWTTFKEWYADQVSKWAVSDKAPTNVVERFFRRLGVALRKFYMSLKGSKYLPHETMREF